MKNIITCSVFIFFISLVFCDEDEKYIFISKKFNEDNIDKEKTYKTYRNLSFTIPSIGYIQYTSSFNEKMKYVGKKGGVHVIESTLTDLETSNTVANIEIMEPYWQAMDGAPCHLYIDRHGTVDHIEPVDKKEHEYLQEAFDAAFNGMFEKNYLYPFYLYRGMKGDSSEGIKEGESWTAGVDSSKFYFTMDSPPSFSWSKDTYKLIKVKDKKSGKIATVKNSATLILDVNIRINILGEERVITGRAEGTVNGKFKWDVGAGEIIYARIRSNLQGDFKMDDETFFTQLNRDEIHRLLK